MPSQDHALRLWQMRAFFSMAALYLFYYFGKKNIGPATKFIEDAFGFSHTRFGWVLTGFTLTYALGQFVNGYLGDRYGPKRIMLIGALGSVAANWLFGWSNVWLLLALVWALNGYFSAMGWAPGCRILCNWFPEQRWGWWMGVYNFFPYLGGALVAPVAAFSIERWGNWQGAFFLPPLFLLGMAGLFAVLGAGAPAQAGVTTALPGAMPPREEKQMGLAQYGYAFRHPRMIVPYAVAFGANAVRWGLLNWGILVLQTPRQNGGFGLSLVTAALVFSMVDWGGMFFSVALGWLSDRVFRGRRSPAIALSLIVAALMLWLWAGGASAFRTPAGLILLSAVVFCAGGLIQGVHVPLFCIPGDVLGQKLAGTGAGIMDGWMYVGAALAGFPLGWWLDTHGLASGIALLGGMSLIFGLLALTIRR